jgi:hypothetical protein
MPRIDMAKLPEAAPGAANPHPFVPPVYRKLPERA